MRTSKASGTTDGSVTVPSVADLDPKTPCPMCREPIAKEARICIHCRSDLTLKRFLPVGSTALAMMTAFIAVVAAVGPMIKQQFFVVQNSDISVVLVDERSDSLTFLATNNGTRVGAIRGVFFEIPWLEAPPRINLTTAALNLNRSLQQVNRDLAAVAREEAASAAKNAKGATPGSAAVAALTNATTRARELTAAAESLPSEWTEEKVATRLKGLESNYGLEKSPVTLPYITQSGEPYFLRPGSTEPVKFVRGKWGGGIGRLEGFAYYLKWPIDLLNRKQCQLKVVGSDSSGARDLKTIPLEVCDRFEIELHERLELDEPITARLQKPS